MEVLSAPRDEQPAAGPAAVLDLSDGYQQVVQNARDIIYMHDLAVRFIWINRTAELLTGFSLDEACRMNISDIIAPDFLAQARHIIEQKLGGGAMPIHALELITKDGQRLAVEVNSWPYYENGGIVGIQGIARDIRERRHTEEALADSQNRYRAFIENSSEGIWLFEVDIPCPTRLSVEEQVEHFYEYGYLAECNDALAQMYGFSEAKGILGAQLSSLLPRTTPGNVEYLRGFINSGYKLIDAETHEFDKDGELKYFLNNLVGIVKNGLVFSAWGTQRDITKLKQAEEALRQTEEQLRQSQKFDAIGQLAGGVAHDFNNLLTVINGYSDMVLGRLPEGDGMRPRIEQIRKAGDRAASLTQQLLAFSRKQILQPEVINLNSIVSEIGPMLRPLIGEHIQLVHLSNPCTCTVKADRGQISQVIMNLVVNARDAMPRGGSITIETANVQLDEKCAARHVGVKPGSYVMLSVTDTGTGMDAATQERMFDPFFTTKEVGKGTGLGLSTVYGIIKQSGGSIWAYSEVGKGTTFKVYLPQITEAQAGGATDSESGELPQGVETILVVEDEEQVRLMTGEILEM